MPDSLSHLSPPGLPVDVVEREVVAILKRVMGKPTTVTRESELLADLGFDSLRVLELVGELEDHFSIAVPLNTLTHVKTVGHIVHEVVHLVASQEAGR